MSSHAKYFFIAVCLLGIGAVLLTLAAFFLTGKKSPPVITVPSTIPAAIPSVAPPTTVSAAPSAPPPPVQASSPVILASAPPPIYESQAQRKRKPSEAENAASAPPAAYEVCMDKADARNAVATGKACRTLYDSYLRSCKENDCRDRNGWPRDMIMSSYIDCCSREARRKLGISYEGPIFPSSTIPTCDLPPDVKQALDKRYEDAIAACEKLR